MKNRVVITGLGAISTIGEGVKNLWDALLAGRSNIEKIPENWQKYSDYNSTIWSPLAETNYSEYNINRIEQKKFDHTTMLALSACKEALENAGLEYTTADEKANTFSIKDIDPARAGVYLGTGIGGVSTLGECFSHQINNNQKKELSAVYNEIKAEISGELQERFENILSNMVQPRRFNPFAVSMIMSNACAGNIAIKYGLKSVNNTYSQACASGTIAIGNGFNSIRHGINDLVITGGAEYFYDEFGALFYSFDVLKTLIQNCDNPGTANRPFDRDRSGFLYSQGGAGLLVLESLEHAQKRGAEIIAEITGFAESCDAHNIMVLNNDGAEISRMIKEALKDSANKPGEIDYINAHGTATQVNDETESLIIEELFGKKPLVNSTKSIMGHTLGASGAFEAIVTALSLKNKTTHISKNLINPIRDLNFVTKTDSFDIKKAVSQSFGFGGHNAALVIEEF